MKYARTPILALALGLTLVACGGRPTHGAAVADLTGPAAVPAAAAPTAPATPVADVPATPLAGTIGAAPFALQDAVWVAIAHPSPTGGANDQQVLIVAGDGTGLCQALTDGTADPNAMVVQLGGADPTTAPAAGSFPLVDPSTGMVGGDLAKNGSYSVVSFVGASATSPTFAQSGTVSVSAIDVAGSGPLTAAIAAVDASGDTVNGTLTAQYCAAAARLASGPGQSVAVTNTNTNIGSNNANNNNNDNNGVGGSNTGGTAVGTAVGTTATGQPVIVNVNINVGNNNTNNNNNNNNLGGGAPNNNNDNNNTASRPQGGLGWLLGL